VNAQVKLGRIAGISIGLHYSWFIIALLITLSLAQHFHTVAPGILDPLHQRALRGGASVTIIPPSFRPAPVLRALPARE